MQKRLLFLVAMMLTLSLTAMAQITTSSMAGKVTLDDQNGEEVIGATVVAIHEPSGTRYTAVTNTSGRFAINGMRTGGPYEVTVSYIGFQPKTVKGITLQLAETYNLSVWLSEDATELAEVVISGKASKFAAEKTGAATNINSQQITNLPTVSRSITDVTRLSPYGGNGMSFAGADGRTANFTVDGANFNNNFGLSSNLPGGGNPISIDAIEELQVVISPYDVRQTNFIGGGVNAITKSGTNTFKGSAYIYHKNENMQGDAVKRQQINGAREKSQTTTYGFTLGGPIIKNKLFFFVNGEMIKIPTVVNRWRGSEDGVSDPDNYISRTTNKDLEAVSKYMASKYGYDTGSWTSFPADESNYKLMARLDWNITDKHHLALRYNYTKNNIWNSPNGTSMDGGTRMVSSRMSPISMSFANSMYSMENLVHSWSLDLNSRLTENLSNQFLATISKLDDIRGTNSSEFPFIDITKDGDNYMALGYELFTWNNAVHNTIWNVKDDVTYYAGAHKIMAGFSFEHQMADNQYMRNGSGYYRFNATDDMWVGGVLQPDMLFNSTPEIFCLTYGYDGETKPAARVQFNRPGVYAQDEWNINDKFKLTYGLRIDGLFFNNSDLMTNNAILALDYDGRNIDTGKWPKNSITFSPRLGFTYDVFGDKSLKVRGGTGLFSGRLPLVFFTNMPTNGGLVQYQAQINAANAKKNGFTMDEFAGGLMTNVNDMIAKLQGLGYPTTVSPDDGTVPSAVNGVDPKFKMPQVWKTSLAFDYQLPVSFPFTATVEGIYNKTINAVSISDWSIPNVGGFARFNGIDNRPIYPVGFRTGTKAFVLENTSRGYGWSASVELKAQPTDWLSLMAAYTHTVSKEVTGMPGSAAESAFTYVPTIEGPNNIKLHNSQYVTPDRLVASATIHDKCGNHYNFVYEAWRGGYNYSYMLVNDMNSDGYNYDALYIPTDAQVENGEFRFVSADDAKRFMDYVHNDGYLKKHQGEYAEPYSLYSPWVHRIDFGYKHDFKLNIGQTKHTLQLTFDMKNVLNFFNSSWGVAKYLNTEIGTDPRILKYEGVDAQGYAVFSTPSVINGNTKTWSTNYSLSQCWYASVGIKYYFN
ncbi:Carboxypeptidase regulatory-like domain-containing protein [Xylanibacter ruminicola]|jgi:outer membrane receptor for ferrienterochelin and colicin|uniref:Carboxypeptidase regulatory-like domain-containing protein n=1 Tax=Xylanibacter ruminicola TaxID=839 RepID=A0A1H5WZS8_XYLRU|nr:MULTISPECIES: carboxypeptidase regulatory-like domain-containing protein [Prevotellaceae]SEG05064.1 Carboxypeptidase regulatory-like domain-containing protein [Xylanibacter ruminicola]